jgi:hypothetical protein
MKLPNEDGFEDAFRRAFDKASLAPPDIIWQNIEQSLPNIASPAPNTGAEDIATSTKTLFGAGAVLVSTLAYLYLNNLPSTNYTNTLNASKNETIITQPIESTTLAPTIEIKSMANTPTIIAKKPLEISPNEVISNDELPELTMFMVEETPSKSEILVKNEIILSQLKPKEIQLPKIIMETPDLIPNTDSNFENQYFDPNALNQPKSKSGFFRNFKISAGFRVSN